ncbi:AAA family ATPase [Bartonella sp. CB178]|uniref:AAA family ATPase n=1 Tax=Bartonella sp. CB178 TaxID=3112255 RepID=UPI00300E14F0
MQFTAFELENFRGISNPVKIDMTDGNPSLPFVIIGDNEAGKTTILEGIRLIYRLCSGEKLDEYSITSMRPKAPYFNKDTILTAYLSYSENEKKAQRKRQDNSRTNNSDNDEMFKVSFAYHFNNSKCYGCSVLINGRKVQPENEILEWIKESIPEIIYHGDFICEVPDKIRFLRSSFLDSSGLTIQEDEFLKSEKNRRWQAIINDIFVGCYHRSNDGVSCDGLDCDIDFQKSVIDYADEDAVRQNLSAINSYLNSVIGENWSDINGGKGQSDFYSLERISNGGNWAVDFQLHILSSDRYFSLHEKSKGFRWFFCFKLLTEIRAKSNRNKNGIVFLLDEPACHLHIDSQRKVLSSLKDLLKSEKNKVIYSTHSPYLISDAYENLFSVRNEINNNMPPRIVCEKISDLETLTEENKRSVHPIIQAEWINCLKYKDSVLNFLKETSDGLGYATKIISFFKLFL